MHCAIQIVPTVYRIVLGKMLAAHKACIHTSWRLPHRRIIKFEEANTRGMQTTWNVKGCYFGLHIFCKQVISELGDPNSNHMCGRHLKTLGCTHRTIISGNKRLLPTNPAPNKLTTSMAKGIKQWRVQHIQTIKPIVSDGFQGNVC